MEFTSSHAKKGYEIVDSALAGTWAANLTYDFNFVKSSEPLKHLVLYLAENQVFDTEIIHFENQKMIQARLDEIGITTIRRYGDGSRIILLPPTFGGLIQVENKDVDNWINATLNSEQFLYKQEALLRHESKNKNLCIAMSDNTPWEITLSLWPDLRAPAVHPEAPPKLLEAITDLWIMYSADIGFWHFSSADNCWRIYGKSDRAASYVLQKVIFTE
jgi:hypothetical protein